MINYHQAKSILKKAKIKISNEKVLVTQNFSHKKSFKSQKIFSTKIFLVTQNV